MKIKSQYSFLLPEQQQHRFVMHVLLPKGSKLYCLSTNSVQHKLEICFSLRNSSKQPQFSQLLPIRLVLQTHHSSITPLWTRSGALMSLFWMWAPSIHKLIQKSVLLSVGSWDVEPGLFWVTELGPHWGKSLSVGYIPFAFSSSDTEQGRDPWACCTVAPVLGSLVTAAVGFAFEDAECPSFKHTHLTLQALPPALVPSLS